MEAQYSAERIEGLQEFAAAVWERRKRIPSASYNDPLRRLFGEFDKDGDGHLTAEEIAYALQSRGVKLTPEVAQKYIDGARLCDMGGMYNGGCLLLGVFGCSTHMC